MLGQRRQDTMRCGPDRVSRHDRERSTAADCLRRRVADEGWGAVRLWALRVVGVGAWWTAALLTVWLGRRLWTGEADLVDRGRDALESGSGEWTLWAAVGVWVIAAVAVVVYAREMAAAAPLVWRWRPWRPYAGFTAERDGVPLWVSAPRVSMPWMRRPEVVWVTDPRPRAASQPPAHKLPAQDPSAVAAETIGAAERTGEEDTARRRAGALNEADSDDDPAVDDVEVSDAEPRGDGQGVLELAERSEADGQAKQLLRLLTPMPSLHSGGLEMMVLVAMGGGVLVHQDVMNVLGIPRDAVTKRARRLEDKGWLSRNEDLSFRMAAEVVTDLEMLELAIADDDEEQAGRIATEIRSRPLPQIQADWLDRHGTDSMRERLVVQADNALTRACETFPDSQGVFERAVVALYGR